MVEESKSPLSAPKCGDGSQAYTPPRPGCLVVGMGASAGGLEAFEQFFTHMPPESGIAFVLVQHLSPTHPSLLSELLSKYTPMPVQQVTMETAVEPNHVYVIPPDATLTIAGGVLQVESPPAEPYGHRTPIDHFFRSLAADQGENAACILLSGTGTDGTLGLRAVKEYGGVAIAQTTESAQYDTIVRSAIATGLVDYILPLAEMPAKLVEYAVHLATLRENEGAESFRKKIGAALSTIHLLLRRHTGHDFSQYKQSTILRRLQRRMQALPVDDVDHYIDRLRQDPAELDFLFKDLLIGVTHFFRDPEAFAVVEREIIPKLFAGKGASDQVRVCVVGCSTGEEAYSFAILLCEHLDRLTNPPRFQVFATDIDEHALEAARRGCYPEGIAANVSAERLERFFIKQDNSYQVKKTLREVCIFSAHSFIKDPPFSRLDFLSCRNVLIYLGSILQQKMLPLFHYALRPGGYLFLGPSETLSGREDLFLTFSSQHRIFQKKEVVPHPQVEFPLMDGPLLSRRLETQRDHSSKEQDVATLTQRIILEHYAPASVVVTVQGEAVYFSGRTGLYLEPPPGTPNVNILHMAREGLRLPLRAAFHEAVTRVREVVVEQVAVKTNGDVQLITLVVRPLIETGVDAPLYLVIFKNLGPLKDAPLFLGEAAMPNPEEGHIKRLEDELQAAEERLHSTIEELETSNEELQSTNEELQSTNEELQTSKEELQSLNEELETVNTELRRKMEDVNHLNSDLQNLLNSTLIATLFLDIGLHIRSFTPATRTLMRLTPSDIGRPITDFAQRFVGADLVSEAQAVLSTLATREQYLRLREDDTHYLMRVLPYRTVENIIDGVVIAFIDITDLKHAEESARRAQFYAESIVETVHNPFLILTPDLRVRSANRAFYEAFSATPAETEGCLFFELWDGQWNIPELNKELGEVLTQNKGFEDFELEHDFPTLGRRTLRFNARQVVSDPTNLILLAVEDVTERKQEEAAQTRLLAMRRVNDELQQFAYVVSHDLNEPLRNITQLITLLAEEYQNQLDERAQEYLTRTVAATQRLQQLLKDLLAYTQVGGRDFNFVWVNYENLLKTVLEDLQVAIAERNAIITHDSLPTIRGDGIHLGQVFQNLISNALKFHGKEPPRIHVSAQRDGPYWRFSIRDNGIGIDPKQAERLFQVFQRLHPRSQYPGTGIGLAICKKIIERHGGRIWVESTPGQGATFFFTVSDMTEEGAQIGLIKNEACAEVSV